MPRCPVCESVSIVVVISPRPRAFCATCGSRWVQEGGYQRAVRPTARGRLLAVRSRRPSSHLGLVPGGAV
jgi:transposase-like protein